jgi:hypothetical protein
VTYIMLKVRWQAEFQRFHSKRKCHLAISPMDKCSFTLVCQAIDSDNKGVEIIPHVIGRLLLLL